MCRGIHKRISILESYTPMNMQTHSSYLFRETWRITRRPLIVVMNVPIRKTDLTRAERTWDGEAYLGHCITRQTKKERRGISKRGRELEAKGASNRALFKDLKERRFDVLVNTFGINLPVDPSPKSGITRMRERGRHHHCQRCRKSLIFHALYRGARRHWLFTVNIYFVDASINTSQLI